ncbi:MAG: tRNA guanosine(34) transglycosylase Tgt [Phycisphaerales bacterium]|nr:tRNA guanosine(34) transglycosylase Tgt [Phycisphaerales bacterium]
MRNDFFTLVHEDQQTKARAGFIETAHGRIETPVFMPVGTVGSVKSVNQQQLADIVDAPIILGNTYHLFLRPKTPILEQAGGLHKFMGWNRAILTDSGGYQVFSLAEKRKITEEGVTFQSHIDGSSQFFSPESVIDVQRSIGADIIMAFDECTPYPSDFAVAQKSMLLTHRWLDRCLNRLKNTTDLYGYPQFFFPIVQGSTFKELRAISCEYVTSKNAVGYAIGGLSVGEPLDDLYDLTAYCCSLLPINRPRYLMGVGTPWNLLECIALGIDMFDCVMPTRNGRNAMLFTSQGIINIDNKKWANDFSAIDPLLPNAVNQNYSKAYLRHLFSAHELLGYQLASIQNLSLYIWLMKSARIEILKGNFDAWKKEQVKILQNRL